MARVLYVSQGYCTHDRRFLERLAKVHEMIFLPCAATSVQRSLPLPAGDIQCLSALSENALSPGTTAWTAAAKRFQRVLREVSPDLVHAGPIPLGGFLTALADFHPALMMAWGSDVLSYPDESAAAKRIVQFALRHCDMAIADCEVVRDRIMQLGDLSFERIVCVPWGVDLRVFRPELPSAGIRQQLGWDNCKIIVSARALEPTHSPFVLLKALQRVFHERGDVRLLMLGDGGLRDAVESSLIENGMRGKVHLGSQVPEPALPGCFAEADLYVSATKSDGSSISLLQTMACGLPVVVADSDGNREWIENGKNGWLYPAEDHRAMARAILEALADDGARRIAGAMNIQIIRARADWDCNFPQVLAAYDQLLNERRSREMESNAELQNW